MKIFCVISIFCSLSIYTANGDQFVVLKTPKSVEFKGTMAMATQTVNSIYCSALGLSIPSTNSWEGLLINDPFNTAKGVIAIVIDGLNELEFKESKSFEIYGNENPISAAAETIKKHDGYVVDLDLRTNVNQTLETVFGVIESKQKFNKNIKTKSKQSQFLINQIALINGLSEMLEENYNHLPTMIVVRLSLRDLKNVKYNEMDDLIKLLQTSIEDLTKSAEKAFKKNALVTLITTTNSFQKRVRRATSTSDDEKFNIAPAYDKNYPVVFNIIFWFSIVMIFSLFAISLAIGNMDPGRDSIIYRMTSGTRMKKDN
ncbi:ATPase H(+)-transporting accessory protein 2 [Culicoides brevitarsis]|uniref:ATPase H(+)-transporting accessory protein 2 n=1 Tax=Culicoides brevitarsis TaxID=469753 RepID=UPI00307BD50B